MSRLRIVAFVAALFACAAPHAASATTLGSGQIQHVVIIIQENRSFDNLFQGLPGADTQSWGYDHNGNRVKLVPISMAATFDPDHSYNGFQTDVANFSTSTTGFDLSQPACPNPGYPSGCPGGGAYPQTTNFAYVPRYETPGYWQLAETYAVCDHCLQSNEGPSLPAHQYMIAGQSGGYASTTGHLGVSDNEGKGNGDDTRGTYCSNVLSNAPAINFSTQTYPATEVSLQPDCQDYPAVPDLLNAKSPPIPYKVYAKDQYFIWNPYSGITHLAAAQNSTNEADSHQVISDVFGGVLPPVTWVSPYKEFSDHPNIGGNYTATAGSDWVASIVNAIGNSPYWANTAIILYWDDWGGWYDHYIPHHPSWNPTDPYEYGYRVPLIAISPYACPGLVEHTERDTSGSVVKFIESVFNLGSLGQGLDQHAVDDLSPLFCLNQSPLPFRPVYQTNARVTYRGEPWIAPGIKERLWPAGPEYDELLDND